MKQEGKACWRQARGSKNKSRKAKPLLRSAGPLLVLESGLLYLGRIQYYNLLLGKCTRGFRPF